MPNLLTLPRELRDEIYAWTLRDAPLPPISSQRRRVAYDAGNDETLFGDSRVRYPLHARPAAAGALLRCCRQVRTELLAVAGRAPLRYKISLRVQRDVDVLYPTWIAVPLVRGRVDVLEAEVRLRGQRTTANGWLRSFDGGGRDGDGDDNDDDDDDDDAGADNVIVAGIALLRRFVERGVHFLGAKRTEAMAVGLLALNMTLPKDGTLGAPPAAFADEVADGLDAWLRGDDCVFGDTRADRGREDEQLCFLAGRIERISLAIEGDTRRVWDVKASTSRRDARRRARGDDECTSDGQTA